ncbi:MAG TPA: TIGR02147 family protein [Bdellovibrionota bacterium]|nr:TIGR02147 family protein [Bdellovibrionota bacterium]
MRQSSETPIFEFKDCRGYLRAVLEKGKASPHRFGVRRLAARAGFRSAGAVSMIVAGKRGISQRSAERLADGLRLSGRKRRYFLAMADLESATTESQRRRAEDSLLRLRSTRPEHLLELRQYRFFSTWYYPALYVLIGLENLSQDSASLARRLGRGVTATEVARAIEDLLSLSLIFRQEDGRLRQKNGPVSADDAYRGTALHEFHSKMIALASESLELPASERETSSLTLAIPAEELAAVQEKIRQFRHELNELSSRFARAERVYQINVQLFPLTQGIPESENPV